MNFNMDAELKNQILKTGTTIIGIVCKDGVVMASDRQSTAGTLVYQKDTAKTNKINDYLVISGCGVASDAHRVPKILAAELKLKELRSRSRPSVKQAAALLTNINYNGIRQPSMIPQQAGFLLGGFNEDGTAELYSISPDGSITDVKEYDANFGSGMTFVLGFLEREYKKGLLVEEGVKLALECLKSSTQRDIYSGCGIDVFTITKNGIQKVVSQEIQPLFKED